MSRIIETASKIVFNSSSPFSIQLKSSGIVIILDSIPVWETKNEINPSILFANTSDLNTYSAISSLYSFNNLTKSISSPFWACSIMPDSNTALPMPIIATNSPFESLSGITNSPFNSWGNMLSINVW